MSFEDSLALSEDVTPPRFFSSLAETTSGLSGNLPHWEQSGKTVFVTYRLADSLPAEKLAVWQGEESDWLSLHPQPWDEDTRREYDEIFNARREHWLDQGFGECLMKDSVCRSIVESSLRHFDGDRYQLYGYVVMPNHVHVCFMPLGGRTVAEVVQLWKSYSAKAVNRNLGRSGTVWQKEYFDRYIRNARHFERVLRYIRRNDPTLAWLATVG